MSFHHLNPDDEPRECKSPQEIGDTHTTMCDCHGSGRLGKPDAKPEIEVSEYTMDGRVIGWFWQSLPGDGALCGNPSWANEAKPFPTESAAVDAAREELAS